MYFVATMLAMMADNIEHVISYWLFYQKFQSPVLAGFAVLSHWTPFLLFAVYFGALADRFDCRKVIQVAQIMYMSVSAAMGVLFYTDTIEVWHACVLLDDPWHGGSALGTGQPTVDPRHRWPRALAKRRAPQLDQPATGYSLRSGRGRRLDAVLESGGRIAGQYVDLLAADHLAA